MTHNNAFWSVYLLTGSAVENSGTIISAIAIDIEPAEGSWSTFSFVLDFLDRVLIAHNAVSNGNSSSSIMRLTVFTQVIIIFYSRAAV